jgi:DNA-binding NarL/FixJ family response regulator
MRLAIFSQDPVIGESLACLLHHTGGFEILANLANIETGTFALQSQRPDLLVLTEDFEGEEFQASIQKLKKDVGCPAMLIHARRSPAPGPDADNAFDHIQSRWSGVGTLCQSIRSIGSSPGRSPKAHGSIQSDQLSRAPTNRLKTLSVRERETVDLLVQGMDNSQIAKAMGLSEPTVKLYVSRLLRLFGVKNRVQLVLLATGHEDSIHLAREEARGSK